YYIGFVFYALAFASYFFVNEVYEIINQSYLLAQVLTLIMGGIYLYPLIIFLFICVFSVKTENAKKIIDSQTKLAASVSVSLGLIGTFQGLTAMVSSIAKSMGGSSDMAEKMNSMLNAISAALSAMSYAFLTSILGVAVSVLLMLSLNFWKFYFKERNSGLSVNRQCRNIHVQFDKNALETLSKIDDHLTSLNYFLKKQSEVDCKTIDLQQKILSSILKIE
ncbi:hypothetical protein GFA11_24455, partial [Salmonella enterica subsp. enterica serovar Kentucky]|nr:hypothetical protein [Salmonella enterica subsp. enterica serovar Kentucky]